MTTHILHDGRTDAERVYDDLKSGAIYQKPVSPLQEAAQEMDRLGISVGEFAKTLPAGPVSDAEMLVRMQRFTAGYQDGQAIAAALKTWPEQKAEMYARIDAVVADRSLSPEEMGQRCAALIADYGPQDVERIDATLATLPSIETQIAAILPMSTNTSVDILAVTLPDGIELTRGVFNGAPAEWVEISRGEIAIDIKGDGSIAGVQIGEDYLDSVSDADWEALRLLLAVDRQAIGRATKLPAAIDQAKEEWNHQPYAEWERNCEALGFGAWYAQKQATTHTVD